MILQYTQFIHSALDECPKTQIAFQAVYVDFQEAFDKVSYDKLLYKLENMGFLEQSLKSPKSYLQDRRQYVA